MTPSEERAIEDAAAWHRRLPHRARGFRDRSIADVRVEERFVRRGLILLEAAALAGMPRIAKDVKLQAVRACVAVQAQLLESGWQAMLDGFYAAAASECRLIAQLCNYVPAASRSEAGARKLIEGGEWRAGDARKVVAQELAVDPGLMFRWGATWQALQKEFDQFAHVGRGLLDAVMHIGEDAIYLGHEFDGTMLSALAAEYAQLGVLATTGVAIALDEKLRADGPWRTEYEQLIAEWGAYSDGLDGRLGGHDR